MTNSRDQPPSEASSDMYEALFKDRYTDRDSDYVAAKQTPKPLCVYPWSSRLKRSYDYSAPSARGKRRFRDRDSRQDRGRYSFVDNKRQISDKPDHSQGEARPDGFHDRYSQPRANRVFYPRKKFHEEESVREQRSDQDGSDYSFVTKKRPMPNEPQSSQR